MNPFEKFTLPPLKRIVASEYRIHRNVEPETVEVYEITILETARITSMEVDPHNPVFPSRYLFLDYFRIKHENVREELILTPVPAVVLIGYDIGHHVGKGKIVELAFRNHGKNREVVDLRLKVIEARSHV